MRFDVAAGVSIWRWTVRHFIPGQQEEFSIDLDTEGGLVGFDHTIPETTERSSLTGEEALEVATGFLAEHITRHPLDTLELIETGSDEKPGYLSHDFTWKRVDWEWGTGIYHLHVRVDGDQVGHYNEHIKTPESWSRDFAKKRSENRIYGYAAQVLSALLGLGVIILFIRIMTRNRQLWRRFPGRWTIPLAGVLFLAYASRFPELLGIYSTNDNFTVFLTNNALQVVFTVFVTVINFLILGFMADVFWQQAFPHHVPIRAFLSGRGLATREALNAVPAGFFLALAMLAYITAYYLAGRHFGIWAPSAIDYAKVLTSSFPAMEALSVGLTASWQEELFYRVLALVFIRRITGSTWLAIIVPAVAWGFMHSDYPQMPGYARGVELTIIGIFFGWVAVRYGILTTLIAHCLFNTWLGALIAWRTGTPIHMTMAVLVSIWPVSLWVAGKMLSRKIGRPLEAEELVQEGIPLGQQFLETRAIIASRHRMPGRSVVITALVAAALMLPTALFIPASPLNDLGRVELTPKEAVHIANTLFQEKTGLDPGTFHSTCNRYAFIAGNDPDYFLAHSDWQDISEAMRATLYQDFWEIVYFRAEEQTTYSVTLRPDGSLLLFTANLGEEETGAQLEREQAIGIAALFVEQGLGLPPGRYRLASYSMNQLTHRRDHQVVFEDSEWEIGESRMQWPISVQGDAVAGFSARVILPEAYERKRSALGWVETINGLIGRTTSIIWFSGMIVILAALLKGRHIAWRSSLLLGLIAPALVLIAQINGLTHFHAGYNTTQTMTNFIAARALGIFSELLISYIGLASFFAIFSGLIRWLTGVDAVTAVFGINGGDARTRYRQGLALALLGIALDQGIQQVAAASQSVISAQGMLEWSTFQVGGISTALGVLLTATTSGLFAALSSGVLVLVLILLRKKRPGLLILALMIVLVSRISLDWHGGGLAAHTALFQIITTLVELWILLRLFRFNGYAYLLFYFYQGLAPVLDTMTRKGWPAYGPDITILWVAATLPILVALAFTVLKKSAGTGPGLEES